MHWLLCGCTRTNCFCFSPIVGVESEAVIVHCVSTVQCLFIVQTREHQAVLCASGAISALASLLSLSAGNEKVSLFCCLCTL